MFGQSFKCLENIDYHPWIEFIFSSVRFGAILVAMRYAGLDTLVQTIVKSGNVAVNRVRKYTDEMVRTRLAMEKDRDDLFEGIVKRREEWVCKRKYTPICPLYDRGGLTDLVTPLGCNIEYIVPETILQCIYPRLGRI